MKKQIANIITISRIFSSLCLLFCPLFSTCFYGFYLLCGLSDMVDGTIARKTNTVSEFGRKLDTFADLIFIFVCLVKVLPVMHIPGWLQIWGSIIAIIKIDSIIWGIIRQKKLIALHTIANKITGFLLFLLPLTLCFIGVEYSVPIVCAMASISAIQEKYYIVRRRKIV